MPSSNNTNLNLGNNPAISFNSDVLPIPHRHRSLNLCQGAMAEEIENAHSHLTMARYNHQITPLNFALAVRALNQLVLQIRAEHLQRSDLVLELIQRILDIAANQEEPYYFSQQPSQ